MVHVVIVEDEIIWLENLKKMLDRILFSYDISYKIHQFSTYDSVKIWIQKNPKVFKIYILDIVLKKKNGLQLAGFIRNKMDDWNSFIVFNTSFFKKYEQQIYEGKYGYLRFLSKTSSYYNLELEDVIHYALTTEPKKKFLVIKTRDMFFKLHTNNILFIEVVERKSKVHTFDNVFVFPKTLLFFKEQLDDNFLYSHKSCLVNTECIKKINKKEKIIYFDNNKQTDLVSDKYLKELISHLEHQK